jgi:3-methylfumaryl-CoA hydratase
MTDMDASNGSDESGIAPLRAGIGIDSTMHDVLTLRMAQAFEATFDGDPCAVREGAAAPPGIHWCLHTPMSVRTADLNEDGTDTLAQGLAAPVSLPRRMRAGGALIFHRPLAIGAKVARRERIVTVEAKQGRTGPLGFVTAEREYGSGDGLALVERIDSVYRAAAKENESAAPPAGPARGDWETSRALECPIVLLLRYSALTFNAHRIHFDERYCREAEGYSGAVVHGPLQATLMLREALRVAGAGAAMRSFEYRARRPLIAGEPARIVSRRAGEMLELAVLGKDESPSMTASARFTS